MMTEDRMRDLLQDPRWSLPAWPDAHVRVRRAARRQRLAVASVGAAVTAFVTTVAMVPVVLLGGVDPGGAGQLSAPTQEASDAPVAGPIPTPPVGAAGFAVGIYPAAIKVRAVTGVWTLCPNPAGLRGFGRAAAAAPVTVLRKLAQVQVPTVLKNARLAASPLAGRALVQNFTSVLRLSDRAFWPKLALGTNVVVRAARASVIYSGPLRSFHQANAPPGAISTVAFNCGSRVVRDTWVVVSGRPTSPATEAETYFLNRRGHVLLYNAASA